MVRLRWPLVRVRTSFAPLGPNGRMGQNQGKKSFSAVRHRNPLSLIPNPAGSSCESLGFLATHKTPPFMSLGRPICLWQTSSKYPLVESQVGARTMASRLSAGTIPFSNHQSFHLGVRIRCFELLAVSFAQSGTCLQAK